MYESIFQMHERPFLVAPRVDRYYPAGAVEYARQTLSRGIERTEGPGLLIGPAGTGKTMLCHLLAEQFRDAYKVVLLSSTRLGAPRDLLQNILFELGLPYRDMEEGEMRLALIDHLKPRESCPHGMLLIVDEAHTLKLQLFEEIRMLTNLVRDGRPRVQLVLAGGPLLEERFASPKLESLNQRIAARCYLHAMNREETCEYLRSQMTAVGRAAEHVFSDDALHAVYTATDGIPRLVNQLCDHALVLAAVGGHARLDAAGIEEAWADLQQLPTPATMSNQITLGGTTAETGDVVEFGQLDDEFRESSSSETELHDDAEFVPAGSAFDDDDDDKTPEHPSPVDEIERRLDEASDLVSAAQDQDAELAAQTQPNPFDESFEEEEVVIDSYASLDHELLRGRPQVSCPDGRELALALSGLQFPRAEHSAEDSASSELELADEIQVIDDTQTEQPEAIVEQAAETALDIEPEAATVEEVDQLDTQTTPDLETGSHFGFTEFWPVQSTYAELPDIVADEAPVTADQPAPLVIDVDELPPEEETLPEEELSPSTNLAESNVREDESHAVQSSPEAESDIDAAPAESSVPNAPPSDPRPTESALPRPPKYRRLFATMRQR